MKKSTKPTPVTIDEYLKELPGPVRTTLENLRRTIQSAAPKAEEVISYGMPAFKHHGMLVYFAAFKNHYSFFPGSASMAGLDKELEPWRTSKGTLQFTTDKPLPSALIRKIVKARVEENEARLAAKKLLKSAGNKTVKKKTK